MVYVNFLAQVTTGETLVEKGVSVNGRMDFELNDYRPGANPHHDPSVPAGH